MRYLITGGLGYIGSHISKILGNNAVILDDCSNSNLNAKKILPESILYKNKISDKSLKKIFESFKIKGVIHLAGLKSVDDSINNPIYYYEQNIFNFITLLKSMHKFKINKLIFSSSATVYSSNAKSPLKENDKLGDTNPYGSTKKIIEKMIDDYCLINKNFKSICLRYFNPIGADYKNGLKEAPLNEPKNLMPILLKAANEKKIFNVYGKDYKTKDGTCIRDFLHILDLAEAHILALNNLKKLNGNNYINLGLGKGITVLELIKLFEKTNNLNIKYKFKKRRKGDRDICYADNSKAKKILNWKPKRGYEEMCYDSWNSFKNQY